MKKLLQVVLAFLKKYLPLALSFLVLLWLAVSLHVTNPKTAFDTNGFGNLPVLANGRIKPLDTVARTSLLILRSKESAEDEAGNPLTPEQWLLDVLMRPEQADTCKVFVISNPDVLGLLDKNQAQGKYYSFKDIEPFLQEIGSQAKTANDVPKNERSLFQREILKLNDRILLYTHLSNSIHSDESTGFGDELAAFRMAIEKGAAAFRNKSDGKEFSQDDLQSLANFYKYYQSMAETAYIRPVPNAEQQAWKSIGDSMLGTMQTGTIDPAIIAYATMNDAWRKQDAPAFNKAVADYRQHLGQNFPQFLKKTGYEFRFYQYEPFYKCIVLYVAIFVLALVSWLCWPETLGRSAFWLLAITFAVHTGGLLTRMWLQGRPPVTNLYSSAIFIGWAACALCIILESIYRDGIGSLTAATMGFITLLIAHHLSFDGDTMEMLRAVLDTNFWLATHVVAVTLGYASTFLAGFLAILYVVRGVFTPSLDKATAKSLNNMVYGIICFAMLFSFVGTVLGGIWADQSWGRFWGFDPKENGALIIVLWNAIILHARWGGFIRERGLMNMAMVGNIVTSFSWFGVNMLGAGLHSYGFMDRALMWLVLFDVWQLFFIGLGMLPLKFWLSFQNATGRLPATPPPLP